MKTATIDLATSIQINCPASKVWEGLTDPRLIKQYFFGTDVVTDWKKGSPILWKGIWEGKTYEEKGNVLDVQPGRSLTFNYWSPSSGTEDRLENYAVITYALAEANGKTELTVTQDGFKDEETRDHSISNWRMIMEGLKKLLEK